MLSCLVTGCAGFIGLHTCNKLLDSGYVVTGVDNLDGYYDIALKEARLHSLCARQNFTFHKVDIRGREAVDSIFADGTFDVVVHLAAQAGVRYSVSNPHCYAESNVLGFLNVLEGCRHKQVRHLVYASSSSVYGSNINIPFAVTDPVDHPLSLYAATKRANELMAHSYAHLYGLPCTGLRFFTVYGPWGRPDMAPVIFAKAIVDGADLPLFNHGNMRRDFTYIDDVVSVLKMVLERPPTRDLLPHHSHFSPNASSAPFRLYNVGNRRPVDLKTFVDLLEQSFGRPARRVLVPMQLGDVCETFADVCTLEADFGPAPSTDIAIGVQAFVEWYKDYYRV